MTEWNQRFIIFNPHHQNLEEVKLCKIIDELGLVFAIGTFTTTLQAVILSTNIFSFAGKEKRLMNFSDSRRYSI